MVTFVLRKHPPACALRVLRCWWITNWCDGRGARHRSAKPATAVRFRFAPQKSALQYAVGHFSFFYAGIYARNSLLTVHLHKELNYHKDNKLPA